MKIFVVFGSCTQMWYSALKQATTVSLFILNSSFTQQTHHSTLQNTCSCESAVNKPSTQNHIRCGGGGTREMWYFRGILKLY